jgi:hypothetical protein
MIDMFEKTIWPVLGRRQFLFIYILASLAGSSLTTGIGVASDPPSVPSVLIRPVASAAYQIRIELEIEGNAHVPKNPLVSRTADLKLPIRSTAVFEYEERALHPDGSPKAASSDSPAVVTLAERYYLKAESSSELNRRSHSASLRDSVRSTIVSRETLPEVIYALDDNLHRDELELLHAPVCSVAVDQLLPEQAVRVGDKYSPSTDAMMSVLNLSAVQSSEVVVEVVEITDEEVKFQLRGDVQGSVEGVPTLIRAAGKLTFDRDQATTTWVALAVHETRDVGRAEPGFDVAGTIKMIRSPLPSPRNLSVQRPPIDAATPIPAERLYVDVRSEKLGIAALLDRHWRMMTDIPGAAMMRMIQNDRSIAQCDFRPLATLAPGQQWTLEAFQQDVKKTLGNQMTSLVSGDEQLSHCGLRVLRVTAVGEVEQVPIQWVVLHFSDDTGRRVLATFTMEGEHAELFGGTDEQLVSSLRFSDPNSSDPNSRELTSDQRSQDQRTANVRSASDLR